MVTMQETVFAYGDQGMITYRLREDGMVIAHRPGKSREELDYGFTDGNWHHFLPAKRKLDDDGWPLD